MRHQTTLRVVGVAGIVAALALFAFVDVGRYEFVVAVLGVIALVAPEVLDRLPFGPNK